MTEKVKSTREVAREVALRFFSDPDDYYHKQLTDAINEVLRDERERQWLPIESAPRGERILIAFPNGHVQQHVLKPANVKVIWFDCDPPDRWMPMPVAAAVCNEERKGE